MDRSTRIRNLKTGSDDQGLKEAMEYYRKAQAEHVTDLVLEERKRRVGRKRCVSCYAGVAGYL